MESHFRASTGELFEEESKICWLYIESHLNSARDIIEKTLFMCAMPECLVVICSFNKEDIISTTSGLDK